MKGKRLQYCFVILTALLIAAYGFAEEHSAPPAEILWDHWGVPHIYGETKEDVMYAWGWAQMKSHGNTILEGFAVGRGRAAELLGEKYLESDRHIWTMSPPTKTKELVEQLPPMPELDAFVAGMNAYAKARPEALDERFRQVLPLTMEDLFFGQGLYLDPQAVAAVREQYLDDELGNETEAIRLPAAATSAASNAWVIGADKSASGDPILLSNTHLPWPAQNDGDQASGGLASVLWFEAHLITPDLDFYGVGPAGAPAMVFGFNEHLGWTVTIPTAFDLIDFYELTLEDDGYLFDGEVKEFEDKAYELRVLQDDGSYRYEEVVHRRSLHGPVIAEREGGAVAARFHEPTPEDLASQQLWDMAYATSLEEFQAALEPQRIDALNIFYADREGNTMYAMAGILPDRPEGDHDWTGLVPGDTSETLWRDRLPFEAMPVLINPEVGFLQNANEPFYTVTLPMAFDPADFPSDWPGPQLWPRGQRSLQLITSQDSFTMDDVMDFKFDTHSLLAEQGLGDVIELGREHGSPDAQEAAEVLAGWDRRFGADSVGAVLFAFWAMHYEPDILAGAVFPDEGFAVPFDIEQPLDTPRGLADPAKAVEALEFAAAAMMDSFGSLEVPWGAFANFQVGGQQKPAFGGPPEGFGLFTANYAAPTDEGPLATVAGDTWVAIVEFGETIEAQAVFSYGNTTNPDSPFFANQLGLYAAKEYRSILLTREEIEANLELRQELSRE